MVAAFVVSTPAASLLRQPTRGTATHDRIAADNRKITDMSKEVVITLTFDTEVDDDYIRKVINDAAKDLCKTHFTNEIKTRDADKAETSFRHINPHLNADIPARAWPDSQDGDAEDHAGQVAFPDVEKIAQRAAQIAVDVIRRMEKLGTATQGPSRKFRL